MPVTSYRSSAFTDLSEIQPRWFGECIAIMRLLSKAMNAFHSRLRKYEDGSKVGRCKADGALSVPTHALGMLCLGILEKGFYTCH